MGDGQRGRRNLWTDEFNTSIFLYIEKIECFAINENVRCSAVDVTDSQTDNNETEPVLIGSKLTNEIIETEGGLRVVTRLPSLGDSENRIVSEWSLNRDERCLAYKWSKVIFNGRTVKIGRSFVPHVQMRALTKYVGERYKMMLSECDIDIDPLMNVQTVYLAQGEDLAEVFFDRVAAAHWTGSEKRVKEVSIEAAQCALKADRETVLRSAGEATLREWDTIRLLLKIKEIVDASTDLLTRMGVNITDIQQEG